MVVAIGSVYADEAGDVVDGACADADDDAGLDDVLTTDDAATPPAAAVPEVGVAQATVKKAVDSRAAAAMPWRTFTSNTFGFQPATRDERRGAGSADHSSQQGPHARRNCRTADKSTLAAVTDTQE